MKELSKIVQHKAINLLLIEDNNAEAELFKYYLRDENNIKIIHAKSLLEGVKFLNKNRVNLIILDLALPDSGGLNGFLQLQKMFSLIPVIILTGNSDLTIAHNAVKAGAQDFLQKDIINEQMLKRSILYAIERNALMLDLNKIKETAKIGVWNLKISDLSMYWSQMFYRITDQSILIKNPKLQDLYAIIQTDDLENFKNELEKTIQFKTEFNTDCRIIDFNKSLKYLNFNAHFHLNEHDNSLELLGFIQDITERERARELKLQNELIVNSIKLKEEFLSMVSHEIRTPIIAVIGLIELLKKTKLDESQKKYIDGILFSGKSLEITINDLLSYQKIESGNLKFEKIPFKLNDIVTSFNKIFEPLLTNKKIEFNYSLENSIPEVLVGDPYRLNQILLNLISNAIKFTNKGYIFLKISTEKENRDLITLNFSIKDSGIGIDKDRLNNLFEKFTQANINTERKYGGSGLGLLITKRLIENQGGKIHVKSELKVGSEFVFKLDFLKTDMIIEKENIKTQTNKIKNTFNGVKIILAEDNQIMQFVAKKIFEEMGIKADIVENGKKVIELLNNKDYDLILIDLQMPEMDGYETAKLIRNNFDNYKKNIPIIALSAHPYDSEKDKCIQHGINDYLTKPIKIDSLNEILSKYVKKNIANGNIPSVKNEAINFKYLNQISNGDIHFQEELINLVKKELPIQVRNLKQLLIEKKGLQINKALHKLKPTLSYLNNVPLINLCNNLLIKLNNETVENEVGLEINHLINLIDASSKKINSYQFENCKNS